MGSIMNVTLVPFGNSKFNGTELECQHGKDECTANSWEQCAITLYPQFSTHWPFYLCVETAAKVRRVARAERRRVTASRKAPPAALHSLTSMAT